MQSYFGQSSRDIDEIIPGLYMSDY